LRWFLFVLILFIAGPALADRTADDLKAFFDLHASVFDALSMRYLPDQAIGSPGGGSTRKGKNTKKIEDVEVAQAPTTMVFTGSSSWANMKATVINYHTHFVGKVETDAPAEKWILKEDATRNEVDSGSLNDAYNFTIDHPGEFKPGFSLTLMIYKDGLQYPSLLTLH
jgi:hypothetical protein